MQVDVEAIKKFLGEFWDRLAIDTGAPAESTDELDAPLDSLTSMEALIEIDKLVGHEIPVEAVIQKGGYKTKEEFVQQVSERVSQFLEEHAV